MPHDDLVLEAGPRQFVWNPVGRAHKLRAGDQGAKILQYLLPGTDFVPKFYEEAAATDLSAAELAEKSYREFGVRVFGSEGPPPSTRPALSRGPLTPDARLLGPTEIDRLVNMPFISDPENKYELNLGGGQMTGVELIFHAWGHQTGDLFDLLEVAWSEEDIVFPHVHTLEEEGFYILEGEFTLYVAEPTGVTKQVGKPGDFVWGPRDYPHYYHISGEHGARVLTCLVPGGGGFLNFFYQMATTGKGSDLSTPEKVQEWMEWVNKICANFFLGPDEWPGEFPVKKLPGVLPPASSDQD
jgi:quercetin dioxygenase-like cupin family protein